MGKNRLYFIAAALIGALSFFLSYFETIINTDDFNWGMQYGSAIDILNGLVPYKESFNGYGILSSLIHLAGILIFGENLVSLGITSGSFYASSFILLFVLFRELVSPRLALLSVFSLFLCHAHIIFPWPNYLAFPILLGSLLLFKREAGATSFFASGFLLASSFA